jgi:hypothetical protein
MAVRLSALRAGRPLPPGKFLVLISVRGCVDPRTIVLLEGFGQLKSLMTSSGIVPQIKIKYITICIKKLRVLVRQRTIPTERPPPQFV